MKCFMETAEQLDTWLYIISDLNILCIFLKAGTHYRIFALISPLRSKPAKARLSDVCKGHGV